MFTKKHLVMLACLAYGCQLRSEEPSITPPILETTQPEEASTSLLSGVVAIAEEVSDKLEEHAQNPNNEICQLAINIGTTAENLSEEYLDDWVGAGFASIIADKIGDYVENAVDLVVDSIHSFFQHGPGRAVAYSSNYTTALSDISYSVTIPSMVRELTANMISVQRNGEIMQIKITVPVATDMFVDLTYSIEMPNTALIDVEAAQIAVDEARRITITCPVVGARSDFLNIEDEAEQSSEVAGSVTVDLYRK